tara:strand:- start:210 stop:341 length:132 start_codon:yes stop_codon:yes gene_type:complete
LLINWFKLDNEDKNEIRLKSKLKLKITDDEGDIDFDDGLNYFR